MENTLLLIMILISMMILGILIINLLEKLSSKIIDNIDQVRCGIIDVEEEIKKK